MACREAPVARAWADQALRLSGTTFLGIIGDQDHQGRCSGHNCGPLCTDRGDYPDGYAHAADIGIPNAETAQQLLNAALHGPAQNHVAYAIHDGTGYYPDWKGGGTFDADGHETHVHVSFAPGTTHRTPDFGIADPPEEDDLPYTVKQLDRIGQTATRKIIETEVEPVLASIGRDVDAIRDKQTADRKVLVQDIAGLEAKVDHLTALVEQLVAAG